MPRDQLSPEFSGTAADQGESGVPSRRSVLRGAAGAGAAGIAATAFAGLGGQALAATTARPDAAEAGLSRPAARLGAAESPGAADAVPADTGPIVAHVRDARTGQIDLFSGTSQVRVHDTDLAAQLTRAAGHDPQER